MPLSSRPSPEPSPDDTRVALSVLATIDPVLRDSAVFGLVVGAPRVVALRHDIRAAEGALRRVVVDATGVVEDEVVPLRARVPVVRGPGGRRPDPAPARRGRALGPRGARPARGRRVAARGPRALAAQTAPAPSSSGCASRPRSPSPTWTRFEHDLLDDDLVSERGVGLTEDDQRAVGEVLAAQLEHADLVVTTGDPVAATTGSGLVDRLRGVGTRRIDGLHALAAADLAGRTHDAGAGERRAHPLGVRGPLPGTPAARATGAGRSSCARRAPSTPSGCCAASRTWVRGGSGRAGCSTSRTAPTRCARGTARAASSASARSARGTTRPRPRGGPSSRTRAWWWSARRRRTAIPATACANGSSTRSATCSRRRTSWPTAGCAGSAHRRPRALARRAHGRRLRSGRCRRDARAGRKDGSS